MLYEIAETLLLSMGMGVGFVVISLIVYLETR